MLLRKIARLSHHNGEERDAILRAVLTQGTTHERREALLRAGLASVLFRTPDDDEPWEGARLPDDLDAMDGQALVACWDWAWASGLLGHAKGDEVEALYATFLTDAHPLARRRALLARTRRAALDRPTLLQMLADARGRRLPGTSDAMFRSLRVEILSHLARAGGDLPADLLLASLLTADDWERSAALATAPVQPVAVALSLLAPFSAPEARRADEDYPARAEWERWSGHAWVHAKYERPDEAALVLLHDYPELPRFAETARGFIPYVPTPWVPPPAPATGTRKTTRRRFSDVTLAGFGPRDADPEATEVEPLAPEDLLALRAFEETWSLLAERPLEWESYEDQEGFFSEEGIDHIEYLAGRARDENVIRARPLLGHLRTLVSPLHRPKLLAALGHPLLGQWAVWLLAEMPPGRDALAAIDAGDAAAQDAVRVLLSWDMQTEAVDAVIDAVAAGRLERTSERSPFSWWIFWLEQHGGLDALARLVIQVRDEGLQLALLEQIARTDSKRAGSSTGPGLESLRRWVRTSFSGVSFERAAVLLRVLGRVGDEADADLWAARVDSEVLQEEVRAAATWLIGNLGGAKHASLLLRLAEGPSLAVAVVAIAGLRKLGGSDQVGPILQHLLRELDDEARDAWSEEVHRVIVGATMGGIRWDGGRWLAAAAVVSEHGSREQVRAMVYALLPPVIHGRGHHTKTQWIVEELAEQAVAHGRFPEHALLAMGARSGGSSYVVPASVTGGGDEVFDDDGPDHGRLLMKAMSARSTREELRSAFLDYTLTFPSRDAREHLEELGGVAPGDAPRILLQLELRPLDPTALELLAGTRRGEDQLRALWTREGIW